MQKKWITLFALLTIILTIGCAIPTIPFLDSAPANTAPTAVDANTLATLVADSVSQKVAQTLEALPPTPTATALPTETPLPSPTPTELPPTATATPIEYPETGSDLLGGENARSYYDYSGNYMVTLPVDWLAIRPGEVEYAEAWGLPVAAYPEVKTALQNMQSLDPNTFRLFVLDTQDSHFDDGFLSNINFLSSSESEATLDEAFAKNVLDLPDTIPGLVVIDSRIEEHSSGERVGIITAEWDMQSTEGESLNLFQKQAVFVIENRALVITFSCTVDAKDTTLPEFDAMLDSLAILN